MLWLPHAVLRDLEELRRASGQQETTQVAEEAIRWFLRVRTGAESRLLGRLTRRQREVLQLISQGHSTKTIAAKLGVAVKTIEMHRTHLAKALNTRGVADLVRFAIRTGLTELAG
ncbi:MAG: LuxR C-terminal-related transcriptional regulator [Gemmataceae bacterium]|nr:LuxR C-terminal-related transcriptional regulator [Gemmataceae bacterium]